MSANSARFLKTVAGAMALGASLALAPARAEAQPSLVILVRHGEKAPAPAGDPPLSELGVARAHALDSALAHTTPSSIVVTPFKRTNETAAVVTKRTGLTPIVVDVRGPHVKNVADQVMKLSGVVLVVGHSNTIPDIVTALGGPKLPEICDAVYGTMFLVTPARDGQPVQVVRTSYGAPPPAGAECAAMSR